MARFEKLQLHNVPDTKGNTKTSWGLVISSEEELLKYHNYDAHANANAFMGLERDKDGRIITSHVGPTSGRQLALLKMLQVKEMTAAQEEMVYPIVEVAKLTDGKFLSMLKLITTVGAVRINVNSGYCLNHDFKQTYNADVLEVIEKDSFAFPVDDEALKVDTLCLENGVQGYTYCDIKKQVKNAGSIATIYNLREVDKEYIFKSLQNAKNVFIQSSFLDHQQVEEFLQLFAKLEPKKVYLQGSDDGFSRLMQNPMFFTLSEKHDIRLSKY